MRWDASELHRCVTDLLCAVRKRNKQLHPYLSSDCQSPSNKSRNRYRGGNGSTSFSSSTIVLFKTHRWRQIPPKRASPQQRRGGPVQQRLRSSLLCYSTIITHTSMRFMAHCSTSSDCKIKRNFFLWFWHRRKRGSTFLLTESTGRGCSSVGAYRGGSTFRQLGSSFLTVCAPQSNAAYGKKSIFHSWSLLKQIK